MLEDPIVQPSLTTHLKIEVARIVIQQDELKQIPPGELALELLSPKRDVITIRVQEGDQVTWVRGVVEYRGDALNLARTEGDCDVTRIANALRDYYILRYGDDGLKIIDTRENGRICDCTVADPSHFSKFLHLIHNNGAFRYPLSDHRPGIYAYTERPDREPYDIRIQMADRVYKPLLKEVISWNDVFRSGFNEWTRLEQDERMWTKKVPKQIVDMLSEAKDLFERNNKLRTQLNELILETTNAVVTRLGVAKEDELGTVDFRLVREPGGNDSIYVSWIWEQEKNLSEYVLDIVDMYPRYKMTWRLETWLVPRPSGVGRLVADDQMTREIVNRILRVLMSKEFAREILRNNKATKELGRKIYALIDEELGRE